MEMVGNNPRGYCACCHWGNNLLCVAKISIRSNNGAASGTSSNGNIIARKDAGFGRRGGNESANGVNRASFNSSCRNGIRLLRDGFC
jgi:hypothetical protein